MAKPWLDISAIIYQDYQGSKKFISEYLYLCENRVF